MIEIIKGRTTAQLIADWEELEKRECAPEVITVRGLYIDEIENRLSPEDFEKWLDGELMN